MDRKEVIKGIKALFSTEEVVENAFEVVTTADGVELNIDEEGNVTIEGEVAPDGDYVISEEKTLTVVDGKLVTEEVVEETPEEVTEEMSTEETPATEEVVVEEIVEMEEVTEEVVEEVTEEDFEGRVIALEEAVIVLSEALKALSTDNEEMSKVIAEFSKTPATEERKLNKGEFTQSKSVYHAMLGL